MQRRGFLGTPLAALAAENGSIARRDTVFAYGDGIPHTPSEYAKLLLELGDNIAVDDYSRGGVVEKLERQMADALGKEYAVWLPTGTLANQLAVRILTGQRRRVLVQAESHLYRDCGDCSQTLSDLNLVALGRGSATFSLDEVKAAEEDAGGGRVVSPIGAIQIESPVRRQRGARFDFETMQKVSAWARERGIGMHLDGARIYLEAAYTGRSVKEYAALFDTVYVSQYKYFNAASGAILAGPKALLENLFHTRRMFGGSVAHAWPYAAVTLHYLEGFEGRMRKAVENSERAFAILGKTVKLERVENGTNILRMQVKSPETYRAKLAAAGIQLSPPSSGWFQVQVNETWARRDGEWLATTFQRHL